MPEFDFRLAGDYSIADIANFSWVRSYDWARVSIDGLSNVSRWLDDITSRPAVRRGLEVPPKRDRHDTVKMAERMLMK